MDYGDITGLGSLTPLPTDFNIAGQATGDMLYYDGANWLRVPAGTSGQQLEANGAAAPTWETETHPDPTDLNISGQSQGDMLYYNGSNWVRVPAGSSTEILTSNGTAAPTWEAPAASGVTAAMLFNFWYPASHNDPAPSAGWYRSTTSINVNDFSNEYFYYGRTMPGALAGYQNWLVSTTDGGQVTMRIYKPAGITTANVMCSMWCSSGTRAYSLQLKIGSVTDAETLSPSLTDVPQNCNEYTIDISSLATGWHDFQIFGRYTGNFGNNFLMTYMNQLTIMGT